MNGDWEPFLRSRFPGYLLPESAAHSVPVDQAREFLERLTGNPSQLDLVRAAAALAPRAPRLLEFAQGPLADLARCLPSRTEVSVRRWERGFRGKLDIAATLALHTLGRKTSFVTRDRKRSFGLAENVLVRGLIDLVLAGTARVIKAGLSAEEHWLADLEAVAARLRHLLRATVLGEIAPEPVTVLHLNAARSARHAAYGVAAELWLPLNDAIHSSDPERVATAVADGALLPLRDYTRFELAVVVRLVEALRDALPTPSWELEHSLVVAGRREVAAFRHDSGAVVRVFYNQAVLGPGPADGDAAHYLGSSGRLRPDVTVTVERSGKRVMAFIVECKCSERADTVQQGLQEARLYRHEYADDLKGWPKAVLVATSSITGPVRVDDDVIAMLWGDWVPEVVVEGLKRFSR